MAALIIATMMYVRTAVCTQTGSANRHESQTANASKYSVVASNFTARCRPTALVIDTSVRSTNPANGTAMNVGTRGRAGVVRNDAAIESAKTASTGAGSTFTT